jgi:hypothetical protein
MEPPIIIKNGHAVTVGGVVLEAMIDSVSGAFWIEQTGTVLNGDAQATIDEAVKLAARFKRVRPDLRFVPPPLTVPAPEVVKEAEVVP